MLFICYIVLPPEDRLSADLWLLNSCTVKGPAEDHFRNDVMEGRKLSKPVVVAGCVPQGQPKAKYIEVNRCNSIFFNLDFYSTFPTTYICGVHINTVYIMYIHIRTLYLFTYIAYFFIAHSF